MVVYEIMNYRLYFFLIFALINPEIFAQHSIHIEEYQRYEQLGFLSAGEYDSIHEFVHVKKERNTGSELGKIVFGYHPYWGGSNYLNYQWKLLSDLCYFSYDVDPETGNPTSYYDWLTSPAVDSALANGTRVHLCVTLFSGQSIFFGNPAARHTLTNNLISLIKQRNACGVNLDFEAVPSSQGANMLAYIAELSSAFHDSLPEGILSIAMPAVDWSGIFDVEVLNEHIDLFMIMGYDYYWNGSNFAGPVDPHYSMTAGYNYNVSRTISYYQSQGMPLDKMLIGIPYYAREWPTASGTAPSATTGYGTAYTYANIKNNASGNYSLANKHWEPNSFSPYFAYEDNGWYQCFVNDPASLGRRYKMVNQRGLAGIGIWALGYDNGYTDLWETIDINFAQGTQITIVDTLYDSGGPSWNYYNDEEYILILHGEENEALRLEFNDFDLETGFDSLWVYDGYYPEGSLIGAYTGNSIPQESVAGEVMSIRFRSDHNTAAPGWIAVVKSFMISVEESYVGDHALKVYPNPAGSQIKLEFQLPDESLLIRMYDLQGRIMIEKVISHGINTTSLDISTFPTGLYLLELSAGSKQIQRKIIKH